MLPKDEITRVIELFAVKRPIFGSSHTVNEYVVGGPRNPAAVQANIPYVKAAEECPRGLIVTFEKLDQKTRLPVERQSLVPWGNLAEVRYGS